MSDKQKEVKTDDVDLAEQQKTIIRWDDSKMSSSYANVCNVFSSREEVTLLFGTNQAWQVGQKELNVHLSDRIVVNPYAAKRLSLLLSNVMGEYEKRFGKLEIEVPEK
jgi:hypothetical protein